MRKLICLIALAILPLGNVVADCIGNSTSSVECSGAVTVFANEEDDYGFFYTPGETWCCTLVGDGSDYSCTNGETWALSSELDCGSPMPL